MHYESYFGSFGTSNLFVVQATLTRTLPDGWTATRQVPTFYLNGNVQGFSTACGALKIANEILNPTNDPDLVVHVHVERV